MDETEGGEMQKTGRQKGYKKPIQRVHCAYLLSAFFLHLVRPLFNSRPLPDDLSKCKNWPKSSASFFEAADPLLPSSFEMSDSELVRESTMSSCWHSRL